MLGAVDKTVLILSPSLFLKDSANASLQALCTIRRLLLLLGVTGLLVGTAAGTWLLGQCLLEQPCCWGQSPGAKLLSEFRVPAAEGVVMGAPWLVSCSLGWGDVAGVGSAAGSSHSASGKSRFIPSIVQPRMLPGLCESTSTLFSAS